MNSVLASLEERARGVAARFAHTAQGSPSSLLEEQIVLLWEHLHRSHAVHQEHLHSILRSECYVDTDLMALDCYSPVLWQARMGARDRLKATLLDLARERRMAISTHDRERRVLEERLSQLLLEHDLLQG